MSYFKLSVILLLTVIVFSCKFAQKENKTSANPIDSLALEERAEIIEDSLERVNTNKLKEAFANVVEPLAETEPVGAGTNDDAADDPAIWYNTENPAKSLVLGTDKKNGMYVYDLEGKELQFTPVGKVNNVDLRDHFNYNNEEVVLVASSNRTNNAISLQILSKKTFELSDTILNLISGVDEVYGICMYKNSEDNYYVFVNGKGGAVEQWQIFGGKDVSGKLLRSFSVNSQPEGMVVNDTTGILFIGVENEAIYWLNANPEAEAVLNKLSGSSEESEYVVYDIEGLALFSYKNEQYLLASIQGNYSYAIYNVSSDPEYVTSFVINDGKAFDAVEETDGLEVLDKPLNEKFPSGIIIVQDGFNYDGEQYVAQNYKYVSLAHVFEFISQK